jgi:hypothetical protein
MSLWEKLTGCLDVDQHERANVELLPDRVDPPYAPVSIQADRDYFRVSLAQMFLKSKSRLLQDYHPAVYSLVQCSFAEQSVEIPNVADASKLLKQDGKGDWIARNFTLLPLMPFKGGEVSIVAGLYAMEGKNPLKDFIGVLGGFAKLLAVPQLSAALSVAQPLTVGIQALFGGGGMHLGYRDTFVGGVATEPGEDPAVAPAPAPAANYLKQGYVALIRTDGDGSLTDRLLVVKNELREGSGLASGQSQPYEKADFMLLRIEIRDTRDDFNELASIAAPRKLALQALAEGDLAKAEAQHRQSLLGAFLAPEITGTDRRRVVDLLKREYNEVKNEFGGSNLVEAANSDFQQRMNRAAINVAQARALGKPTYDEVFSA